MPVNLSDFIRWARDKVIENPEVATYELVLIGQDRDGMNEFECDHDAKEILMLCVDEDEVELGFELDDGLDEDE